MTYHFCIRINDSKNFLMVKSTFVMLSINLPWFTKPQPQMTANLQHQILLMHPSQEVASTSSFTLVTALSDDLVNTDYSHTPI